jgi:subtilisin family serine protease
MRLFATILTAVLTLALASSASAAGTAQIASDRYTVLLAGTQTGDGFEAAAAPAAVRSAVSAAGGTVVRDLSRQVGMLVVTSPSPAFADVLRGTGLVEDVGRDFKWRGKPSDPGGGPFQTQDLLEPMQWDMQQIRTPQAHDVQAGARSVDVGILDSGIDGRHPEFTVGPQGTNVDCARGRNSITFVPEGPGVGTPDPCTDNQFHGTHVAGTVGMQANQLGMVGVAPNVTLVPVKVCDTTGYCYASPVVDGITYAGDQQFDVINMSFFVDDNEFQESTEFKCNSDPVQRTFRHAVERAIQYARGQGVTPVAALGNSDNDLAHPPEPYENECEVVPAETQGVIGVAALGRNSEKAGYSNYGNGPTDVAAPGGNGTTGDCNTTVPSTFPGSTYFCIQGTSMASPHAAGVAALIVSQFGELGEDGDVKLAPQKVESLLQSSAIDIGEPGYDECFGHGRIDALRAVTGETGAARDETAPDCPEYQE